ncbi:hypothetical protein C8Q70DRAFT_1058213 [Cubamyces menziesii]|uniref:DUF6534 domain-containing protein n=1 Tax=Trametes cubensis TaxID=1111947 RepID=A0AAD7TVJ9_9APHY|nr:hypothetical protein C8Q70DRAFT_1058213 [Cubamyces menziesii]KAJ8486829.1 hypothetical protein ONZ51_g4590 [Trametes cubensis]
MAITSFVAHLQSVSDDEALPLPSLSGTVGTYALGTFVSLILYGVSCLQLYRYGRLYPSDSVYLKVLVVTLMLWETLHSVATMHSCYYYLVTNYFNPLALVNGVWSLNIQPVVSGTISLIAFIFFARRVSLIGPKSSVVALTAILLLLASNALTIVITTKAFRIENIQQFGEQTHGISSAFLALAASADYVLAAALIVVLIRDRANHTRASWIEVATTYILNTGLLTGTLQWLAAIMSLRFPSELYWATFGLITMKFRAITLFSVLNSRKTMSSRGITVFNDSTYTRSAIARAHRLTTVEQFNVPRDPREDGPPVINIKVAAETEIHGRSYASSILDIHEDMVKAEC